MRCAMKILLIEPGKAPAEREISGTLESMRETVGGTIQALYPFDEPVALVCNDDGKDLGLPLNRALFDPDTHRVIDIIAGTFLLCGAPPDSESFVSLTGRQVEGYRRRFASPEQFINLGGEIFVLPRYL